MLHVTDSNLVVVVVVAILNASSTLSSCWCHISVIRNTRVYDSIQNDFAFDRIYTRGRCGRGYFMDTIGLWNRLSNEQIALDRKHFKKFIKRRQF